MHLDKRINEWYTFWEKRNRTIKIVKNQTIAVIQTRGEGDLNQKGSEDRRRWI